MNRLFRNRENEIPCVVQEVGRDPLRPDIGLSFEETIVFAQKASAARQALAKVLPQPREVI